LRLSLPDFPKKQSDIRGSSKHHKEPGSFKNVCRMERIAKNQRDAQELPPYDIISAIPRRGPAMVGTPYGVVDPEAI
jgi:hypothetical protein